MDSKEKRMVQIGVILWVSFLFAGVATMLFFATFDPSVIGEFATYPVELSRTAGYSLGFLLFWVLLIVNSSVVVWLSRKSPKN